MEDYDKFYAKVWKQNESSIITIPFNIVKGLGLAEGDQVVVMLRKHDTQ